MTDNKKIESAKQFDETDLEKVDGGLASAFIKLASDFDTQIPASVMEKLRVVKSDVDFRRILEENGIDSGKIEKKIRTASLGLSKKTGF